MVDVLARLRRGAALLAARAGLVAVVQAVAAKVNGPKLPPTSLQLVQDRMEALQPRGPLPDLHIPGPVFGPIRTPNDGAPGPDALIADLQQELRKESHAPQPGPTRNPSG